MSLRKGPFSTFTLCTPRSKKRHASGTSSPSTPVGSEQTHRVERSGKHVVLQSNSLPDAMSLVTCCQSNVCNLTEFGRVAHTTACRMDHLPSRDLRSSLSEDSDVNMLMHHYAVNVADIIQPIRHFHNTYRDLYLPTALQGAHITVSDSKIQRPAPSALFHALLASAAFHLWNCNMSQTKFRRLGSQHRVQALRLLQSAIDAPNLGTDYRSLMMSMLALITIGVSVNKF